MKKVFPEFGVLVALVVLMGVMSFASPYFLTSDNLFNILEGMAPIGIMAIGMTMVIITGGIDLSVGSLMAVSAILTARMVYFGYPWWLALACGMGAGSLLGMVNGLLVTKARINAFIVTLGMLSVARGIAYFLSTGIKGTVASNIPVGSDILQGMGGVYVFDLIPITVIEMLLLVFIFIAFLKHTVLGREIYAVGSNLEAARLSGVPVDKVRIFVYTMTGALCAIAGIVEAGKLETATTNAGVGIELDVIAAVVIGGASLMGGKGSVLGAIIGAAIMAVLRNSFVLLHLPAYTQTITIGVVIVLAVGLERLKK